MLQAGAFWADWFQLD